MEIDLVRAFAEDATQACRDCSIALELSSANSDLVQLQQAARRAAIERRGTIATPSRHTYEYYVHGAGYSFKELSSGKEMHFDVVPVEGVPRIRFSAFSVVRYASSFGMAVSREGVQSDLNRLSQEHSSIVHVVDGPFDYFYWMGE
jgi:hypothetical protein